MNKKIVLISALFLFAALYIGGNNLSASLFEKKEMEKVWHTQAQEEGGEMITCKTINWENGEENLENIINPYLEDALDDGERYNPNKAVESFLKDQDEAFEEWMDEFTGGRSTGECDLTQSTVDSAINDANIDSVRTFREERRNQLKQISCALEEIATTPDILCFFDGPVTRDQLFVCDTQFREQEVVKIQNNLEDAMKIGIRQAEEMVQVWPLHKRIECLNEDIADQRHLLLNLLDALSKMPPTFANLGTQ